jgi:hypothetical protein
MSTSKKLPTPDPRKAPIPVTKFSSPPRRSSPIPVTTLVEPLYLNREQLAQAVLTSARTIDNWRELVIIPFIKVRGVVRFDLAKVKAALERRFEVQEKSAPVTKKRGAAA